MESDAGILANLDAGFRRFIVDPIGEVLFADLVFWDNDQAQNVVLPIVVVWLVVGALFFTLRFQFINLRAFRHAIDCVRGVYTQADEPGEILQAIGLRCSQHYLDQGDPVLKSKGMCSANRFEADRPFLIRKCGQHCAG